MKKLTIERTFSAPINHVWEAFTNADKLKQWWAPPQMTCSHLSLELKEGGIFRYAFKDQNENEFWGRGVFQTINKPSFLSYLDTFTDADGNPVPPSYFGIPGDDIVETLAELHFEQEGEKTKLKLVGDNSYDDSMTEDMTKGWNGMFDNLNKLFNNK